MGETMDATERDLLTVLAGHLALAQQKAFVLRDRSADAGQCQLYAYVASELGAISEATQIALEAL